MKDKSMVYMAGTSMGSYNKPMMKGGYDKPAMEGSGLMMKCGCQIGKHMGGPKMMGKVKRSIKKGIASGDVFGSNNKCS